MVLIICIWKLKINTCYINIQLFGLERIKALPHQWQTVLHQVCQLRPTATFLTLSHTSIAAHVNWALRTNNQVYRKYLKKKTLQMFKSGWLYYEMYQFHLADSSSSSSSSISSATVRSPTDFSVSIFRQIRLWHNKNSGSQITTTWIILWHTHCIKEGNTQFYGFLVVQRSEPWWHSYDW